MEHEESGMERWFFMTAPTYEFGFIGTGDMGGALAQALCQTVSPDQVLLANRTAAKAEVLAGRLGCDVGGNEDVARQCRFLLLGVKPQMMADTLAPLRDILSRRADRFVLVTMAAGITMERLAALAGGNYPVIRIMPNTPCAVGEGIVLCDANGKVTVEELDEFTDALSGAGIIDRLDERLMDAGSAVSGCGPAFVCLLLEALADSGVACGLPRKKALLYAAQMVKGTAELQLATGDHPGVLKDAVCSPGGTAIAGVRALEERSFRAVAMGAVIASAEKTKELGK